MPHNCIIYAIYILQFFVILLLLVLTEITLILVIHIFHDKVGQKWLGVTICLLFGCFFLCAFSQSPPVSPIGRIMLRDSFILSPIIIKVSLDYIL